MHQFWRDVRSRDTIVGHGSGISEKKDEKWALAAYFVAMTRSHAGCLFKRTAKASDRLEHQHRIEADEAAAAFQ